LSKLPSSWPQAAFDVRYDLLEKLGLASIATVPAAEEAAEDLQVGVRLVSDSDSA
jgi:hypothetical protein